MTGDPGLNTLYTQEDGGFKQYWKYLQQQKVIKRLHKSNPDYYEYPFYIIKPVDTYGDQVPIRPIKRKALETGMTTRMRDLALPRIDKRVYIDRLNTGPGHGLPITAIPRGQEKAMSGRMQALAAPRPTHADFSPNPAIENKIKIAPGTLKAKCTDRIAQLSQPKQLLPNAIINDDINELGLSVPRVKKANKRIREMAAPRVSFIPDMYALDEEREIRRTAVWPRKKSTFKISERQAKLAEPKGTHDEYEPNLSDSEIYVVTSNVLRSKEQPRLAELAEPVKRPNMKEVWYRPDEIAFGVDEIARKAFCSPRLKELAEPRIRE